MINYVPLTSLNLNMQNSIRDKAIIAYDAQTDSLYDSGIFAPLDGELEAAAGTVSVGLQDMSSAGEEVVWYNNNDDKCYAPPWHVVDEATPGGSVDRFYGPIIDVVREADNSTVVTDPSFEVNDGTPRLVTRMTFEFPVAQNGMVFEVLEAGESMWRMVKDVSAGVQEMRLDIPVTFPPGLNTFKIYRLDGQPAELKGNPTTLKPYYKVRYREVTEKPMATKEDILTFSIPRFYKGAAASVDDALWPFIGVNASTPFIHLEVTTAGGFSTPIASSNVNDVMRSGVDFTVYNTSSGDVTITARTGEYFEEGNTSVVPSKTYRHYIKNGITWFLVEASSYDAALSSQVATLTTNNINLTTRVVALEEGTKPLYLSEIVPVGGIPDNFWGIVEHQRYIFVAAAVAAPNTVLNTPVISGNLVDEQTEFFVLNKDNANSIAVTPRVGETMNGGATAVTVEHGHIAHFIKNSVDWVLLTNTLITN